MERQFTTSSPPSQWRAVAAKNPNLQQAPHQSDTTAKIQVLGRYLPKKSTSISWSGRGIEIAGLRVSLTGSKSESSSRWAPLLVPACWGDGGDTSRSTVRSTAACRAAVLMSRSVLKALPSGTTVTLMPCVARARLFSLSPPPVATEHSLNSITLVTASGARSTGTLRVVASRTTRNPTPCTGDEYQGMR